MKSDTFCSAASGTSYGSISFATGGHDSHGLDKQKDFPRKSNFTLLFGTVACATAAIFLVCLGIGNSTSNGDGAPQSLINSVEILGEVHRSPADTPLWYSQRRDHFEDFEYADTWQVSNDAIE